MSLRGAILLEIVREYWWYVGGIAENGNEVVCGIAVM